MRSCNSHSRYDDLIGNVDKEDTMRRERALKVVLVLLGLLFCAGVATFFVIGMALMALGPAKRPVERLSGVV